MTFSKFILAGIAAASLAACSSNGGGTGGTGGTGGGGTGGGGDYDTELKRVQDMVPTSDMPTSLNATYTGMTRQDLRETSGGAVVGTMMADLELTADWTEGQTTNPWSGKADNFRGDLDGTDFDLVGELTVASAESKSITSTIGRTANTIALPTGGSTTVATGAAAINLAGDVDDGTGTNNEVLMSLGGSFFGAGGKAITGPASTQGFRAGGVRSDLVAGGDFYVEQ